jgi:hypothetical protein
VFPGGKPLSNMAMLSVLKDMNCDEPGESRWIDPKSSRPITPHRLRATFRTWGEDTGFPGDHLEESLAIRSGVRWSDLIGVPTALIDDVQSCRLGPISAVPTALAVGVFNRRRGLNTSLDAATELL